MGGEVEESTQKGENKACSLVKEAVLRQILQHTLTVYSTEMDEGVITLAEEQLDTLYKHCWRRGSQEREERPPLPRNLPPPKFNTYRGGDGGKQHTTGNSTASRSPHQNPHVRTESNGLTSGEDAWHVTQFIRRHGPGDGLGIASSVLYATIGVTETQMGRNDETILVRTIAGKLTGLPGTFSVTNNTFKRRGVVFTGAPNAYRWRRLSNGNSRFVKKNKKLRKRPCLWKR